MYVVFIRDKPFPDVVDLKSSHKDYNSSAVSSVDSLTVFQQSRALSETKVSVCVWSYRMVSNLVFAAYVAVCVAVASTQDPFMTRALRLMSETPLIDG